jgi:hypothetical protein
LVSLRDSFSYFSRLGGLMSNRDKKFVTQEILSAISSSTKTGKTTQVAFELSDEGYKKLKIDAAMDDITPAEKAREVIGLGVRTKKAKAKLIVRLSERDFTYLALRYAVDPEDKLTIRNMAADEIARNYPDDEEPEDNRPDYQWPD